MGVTVLCENRLASGESEWPRRVERSAPTSEGPAEPAGTGTRSRAPRALCERREEPRELQREAASDRNRTNRAE